MRKKIKYLKFWVTKVSQKFLPRFHSLSFGLLTILVLTGQQELSNNGRTSSKESDYGLTAKLGNTVRCLTNSSHLRDQQNLSVKLLSANWLSKNEEGFNVFLGPILQSIVLCLCLPLPEVWFRWSFTVANCKIGHKPGVTSRESLQSPKKPNFRIIKYIVPILSCRPCYAL